LWHLVDKVRNMLWVMLYVFFKGLVSIYSIGLINSVYLGLYKILYYNADFFYKGKYKG